MYLSCLVIFVAFRCNTGQVSFLHFQFHPDYVSLHSLCSNLFEPAIFNMLSPVMEEVPSSYWISPYYVTRLRSVGHDPTRPIVIDSSDEEINIGPSAPAPRHRSQLRKHRLTPEKDRIKPTTGKNRRQCGRPSSSSHSQCQNSQNVLYPDLAAKIPQAKRDPFNDIGTLHLHEHLDRQPAQRLQQEEEEKHHQVLPQSAPLEVERGLSPNSGRRKRQRRRSSSRNVTSVQQGTRDKPIELASDHLDSLSGHERLIKARDHRGLAQLVSCATWARKEVSVANRECTVCDNSSPVTKFPLLADCKHPPQTCSTCYAKWITMQLKSSSWMDVRCPETKCNVKMSYNEIQLNASFEVFQQYDTFIARAVLNKDRKFRHPAILTR
jgi:hypothetical protein